MTWMDEAIEAGVQAASALRRGEVPAKSIDVPDIKALGLAAPMEREVLGVPKSVAPSTPSFEGLQGMPAAKPVAKEVDRTPFELTEPVFADDVPDMFEQVPFDAAADDARRAAEAPRKRQGEILTGETIRRLGGSTVYPEVREYATVQYKNMFGAEPDENDIGLMQAFGMGYKEGDSPSQKTDLTNMLKVSASLLEAAPELAKLDTVAKFSNGAPVLLWRGGKLRDLVATPMDMFSHRINNPEELGAHVGTYDQAQHFTTNVLGKTANAIKKGNRYGVDDQLKPLVRNMLPRGLSDTNGATNKVLTKLEALVKDFIEIDMAKTEPELLMKMDDSGVLIDDAEKLFYTNHKDELLGTLKEVLQEDQAMIASEIDTALKDADTYLKARLFSGLSSKDAGGTVSKRVGQMVPFVPVYKNPIVFRDVNNNDAVTIIESVMASPSSTVSDPEAFIRVVERFTKLKEKDMSPGTEKLFQQALEEEGFDAAQYVNFGEGVGNKVSLVVFNEKNVKPLHEAIPALGKLKEVLRQKVYDLMAMGVPLTIAIEYVTGTEENDPTT